MRSVTRFESNLLRILQCVVGQTPASHVQATLMRPCNPPRFLSRDAVELVQQMLAGGTLMRLVRGGAWKRERFLRGDQICEGSLWQRTPPEDLGLEFSELSLELLIWLTECDASRDKVFKPGKRRRDPGRPTIGDQFLFFLASQALSETPLMRACCRSEPFLSNGLIGLARPDLFADQGVVPEIDFASWMTGSGAWLMESLQEELRLASVKLEQDKSKIHSCHKMSALGRVQSAVLQSLLDAAEQHHRRDLCRFLLEAAGELMRGEPAADQWIASLEVSSLRLAERTEVYRHACALLEIAPRLLKWHRESVGIGYFDEGYGQSQLWKSAWESTGAEQSMRHAQRMVRELEFQVHRRR